MINTLWWYWSLSVIWTIISNEELEQNMEIVETLVKDSQILININTKKTEKKKNNDSVISWNTCWYFRCQCVRKYVNWWQLSAVSCHLWTLWNHLSWQRIHQSWIIFWMPPFFFNHNFKIQRYHQNEPQFNDIYSRNHWVKHVRD